MSHPKLHWNCTASSRASTGWQEMGTGCYGVGTEEAPKSSPILLLGAEGCVWGSAAQRGNFS